MTPAAFSQFAALFQSPDLPITNAFTHPATEVARRAVSDSLRAFWLVIPFILLAEVLLVYVIFRFRDKGDGRKPATFSHNNLLEFAWTVIPAITLLVVAIPSFKVLKYMEFGGANSSINIRVTGHQFFWEYSYPQYGIDISNDHLVVPAHQVVNLDLTSVDVIHGFFVPALGIQIDALPGRITNLWFNAEPGSYKGQCTQLCGTDHGKMLIDVDVLPEDQFQQWLLKHQSKPAAAPAAATPSAAPASMSMPGMAMPATPAPAAKSPAHKHSSNKGEAKQ